MITIHTVMLSNYCLNNREDRLECASSSCGDRPNEG